MLTDFTRNLFYFFRGPTSDDDPAHDRQLENNLTKSLIVVLEHADRVFLDAFARRLGLAPPDGPARFSLQRRPVGAHTARKRIVLGITGGSPKHAEHHRVAGLGRPDAWILTGHWAVLVESKLGSKIFDDQLRGHAQAAGWAPGSYDLHWLSWQEIYAIFHDEWAKLANRDSTSHLLAYQWLDYLRGQNMIPFDKLESDDFDYLNLPKDEQRPLVSHIHRRLEAFQEQLKETAAAASILKLCGLPKSGPWKHGTPKKGERLAWFNVGGDGSTRSWHVTLFFRPHGLDVEVIGASKGLTRRLAKAGVETVADLVRLCVKSPKSPAIAICCRRIWYADPDSGYKAQRISHSDEPLTGHPSLLAESTRDEFAKVLFGLLDNNDRRYRTELSIRYSIARREITKKDIDVSAQVGLVEDALLALQGPLEFLMKKAK
jgi:hypothetical protein